MQNIMYISLYLNQDEHDFIKSKPEGYIRTLVQETMGTEIDQPPIKIKKDAPEILKEKLPIRKPVPKIEGVSVGLRDLKPDKRKCKACGFPLNSIGQCSQKGCNKFMRTQ